MKLLDTNIILYALGRPHLYKEPCARLLEQIRERDVDYVIDAELVQEVLYVYSARGERLRGLATFDNLLVVFPNPVPITRDELIDARRLMEAHPALSPRDALHAAVVQTQRLEGIVTTDQVFREVRGLAVFDPRDLASGG